MAIMITDECINCGACEPECPNTAIFEAGADWNWGGKTKIEFVEGPDGTRIHRSEMQPTLSDQFYYIVHQKCTECTDYHETPTCAEVCPISCCVDDPNHEESADILRARKKWLHCEPDKD